VKAAVYARVSTTTGQTCENQLIELRCNVEARGWSAVEYVDDGVSGAKERRPALDALLKDARRRRFDVVSWSLDRMGRSLKHLVVLLDDLHALGVSFISIREGLDWTTPTGRLQAQLLAMIAEFERSRIQERVRAGLQRARAQGRRLGRPRREVPLTALESVSALALDEAAASLNVSRSTLKRWRRVQKSLSVSV
jgi:DNA invertase Pin-like site-specific DNA recombinase